MTTKDISRWGGIQMTQERVLAGEGQMIAAHTKQHEEERHTGLMKEKKEKYVSINMECNYIWSAACRSRTPRVRGYRNYRHL